MELFSRGAALFLHAACGLKGLGRPNGSARPFPGVFFP